MRKQTICLFAQIISLILVSNSSQSHLPTCSRIHYSRKGMNKMTEGRAWQGVISFPLEGRKIKPRTSGLTMVMDKGLGLAATKELLETSGNYIDYIKFGFGTSALLKEELLQQKIALIKSHGIYVYPGGTFLEIAYLQGRIRQYLQYAQEIGFNCIEVSDGTVTIDNQHRQELIMAAQAAGFTVITEVGKKNPLDQLANSLLIQQIQKDLSLGVSKVILEGRETGKGIGLYDQDGSLKKDDLSEFLRELANPERIIWEAPLKNQQQDFIGRLGPNVNLGNIPPSEVIPLEALRVGLRGDTLRFILS